MMNVKSMSNEQLNSTKEALVKSCDMMAKLTAEADQDVKEITLKTVNEYAELIAQIETELAHRTYIKTLSADQLIKEFTEAVLANDYGSHADYIADLKAEMLRRMSKEA